MLMNKQIRDCVRLQSVSYRKIEAYDAKVVMKDFECSKLMDQGNLSLRDHIIGCNILEHIVFGSQLEM
ncbi:32415_t:CDS:2 [Gigaspora margarita]|uniref:32415_t:CDS:1 n=1 Tax=Gigaspora margarita TaxID=4874 RepID=A0ABN7W1Z2_GIGMA|nr:32415_t:CDS:2 [Gigaspora margarita]